MTSLLLDTRNKMDFSLLWIIFLPTVEILYSCFLTQDRAPEWDYTGGSAGEARRMNVNK